MKKLRVDVWSDVACPWCYVGKRRLERALAGFEHEADVEVVWRAFELDPEAPRVRDDGMGQAERLAKKYRRSVAEAEGMIANMTRTAAADGLEMRFDQVQSGNTFDAHRVIHLAAERGKQDAMKERLMRAYFTEGRAVGEAETLVALGQEVGLEEAEVKEVLASAAYAEDVRGEEMLARELGITGVPFFVLGGRLGVSGAQPAEVLLGALREAWKQVEEKGEEPGIDEGAVCGPDGC